jgi:RND superfamily putative drug exporter
MSTRQVSDVLAADFAGNAADKVDIVTTGPVPPAATADYARAVSELPGVVRVDSSTGTFAQGAAATADPGNAALGNASAQRYSVVIEPTAASASAQQLVKEIRALPAPDSQVHTLVGGPTATLIDSKHSIGSRLPIAVGMVAVMTFVLLFLFTGSVVQPVRALLVNGLGLAASLGVMTWIFKDGHLSSVFDITARPMDTSMTVLLLIVAFGLSMDYEVFLTSRVKELHDRGADTRTAMVQGLARTGRIISTAAVLLAVALFSFATSTVSFLQMFGLGAGLAVLLDATLIRGVLVPAVTVLVGERIWYAPPFLRRLHDRIGISEAPVPELEEERVAGRT